MDPAQTRDRPGAHLEAARRIRALLSWPDVRALVAIFLTAQALDGVTTWLALRNWVLATFALLSVAAPATNILRVAGWLH
jgi:hypothetical protein